MSTASRIPIDRSCSSGEGSLGIRKFRKLDNNSPVAQHVSAMERESECGVSPADGDAGIVASVVPCGRFYIIMGYVPDGESASQAVGQQMALTGQAGPVWRMCWVGEAMAGCCDLGMERIQ